jgi:hypothetical protein
MSVNLSKYNEPGMMKRLIAALVLTALAGWSVPGSLAASSSSIAEKSGQQAAASEHDHLCCPGVHSRFVPPLFVKPGPASVPCGEQHPCCAKPGSENPPSLPANTKLTAPGSDGTLVAIADQDRDDRTLVGTQASGRNPLRAHSARSTVLRI